jgi:ABC-type sugar transport system substrate-binding protein
VGDQFSPASVEAKKLDRRTFVGGAAAFSIALVLEACGSSSSSSSQAQGAASTTSTGATTTHYVIGIGLPFRTSIVYKPLLAGFEQGAKETGSTILQSSSADDLTAQLTDLNAWIARPVNAITMFPLSENALAPLVRQAHSKHIKVVGYSVHVPGEDGYVIFDNEQGSGLIGNAAVQWLNQNKGGKGSVAVLDDTTQVARERLDPALAILKQKAPGAQIVARPKVDPPVTQEAFNAAQSILQANPDVNMFLCVDDDEALGVHQAVKAAGRAPTDVWIAGMDGSLTAMQQLLNHEYVGASGALPLKEIGRQAVRIPVNLLTGKGPSHYVAKYLLVTNDTPALAKQLIADYGSKG